MKGGLVSEMTVAVAITDRGRHHFVSADGNGFARVAHFPCSLAEARKLSKLADGPTLSHEQLVAVYASEVTLVPLKAGSLPT
jgi:hypothetical protein